MSGCKKKGVVVRGHGKQFIVRADGEDIACEIRGKVKHSITLTTPVAVGDDVVISLSDDGSGMIEEVGPRRTMFMRPAKESDKKRQVIAANIDQLAAVVSVKSPELKPGLIDRIVIAAEIGNLRPLVIINKIDLSQTALMKETISAYDSIDIPVFAVSAKTGEGIDKLEPALSDHKTIFAGHSGVGKSTLLNWMIPGLNLRIGDVSEATDKGVHTTSHVELFELPKGGYVLDSPGLKIMGLWEVAREDLPWYYPEMREYVDKCRFTGCSHTHEPDCAVKEAVTAGEISRLRYDNYCSIYESLG
jgi:ribosome biogenesis GTPase